MLKSLSILSVAVLTACAGGEGTGGARMDGAGNVPESEPPAAQAAPPGTGTPGSTVPDATVPLEACLSGAYLCLGLAERDEPRVLRWADGTDRIRILVPRPQIPDANLARALQDGAVAGLRAWQEKPFPLEVRRSGNPDDTDFTVRWSRSLEGTQLGRTGTEWNRTADGRTGMRVRDLVLALEDPFAPGRIRSAGDIRLTAAHEMGHALGLPHSDSERDVMYPTNTATALTARDYSAMTALYAMENGAIVVQDVLDQLSRR